MPKHLSKSYMIKLILLLFNCFKFQILVLPDKEVYLGICNYVV